MVKSFSHRRVFVEFFILVAVFVVVFFHSAEYHSRVIFPKHKQECCEPQSDTKKVFVLEV